MKSDSAIVVGAGVIGAAVAHALSREGMSCIVLERGPRVGEGVTSRNSGVIHAGIYYPPGSLKAESCIRGNALLYEWCVKMKVPHRRTGKWIMGSMADKDSVDWLFDNAAASGAVGLSRVGDDRIFSASSGAVDPYELTRSLQIAAEEKGAQFIFECEVSGIDALPGGGYSILTSRGPVTADVVVNCAGLQSDRIAALVGVSKYRIYPWRGDYFRLLDAREFPSHIYPVKRKNDPGLGVHLTVGLDGSYRLGPDAYLADSVDQFGEPVDLEKKKLLFAESASRFLGPIAADRLRYDTCGIRPKLRGPSDQEEKDFVLSEDRPRFINLIGIESPGLTASLDLAERVARKVLD